MKATHKGRFVENQNGAIVPKEKQSIPSGVPTGESPSQLPFSSPLGLSVPYLNKYTSLKNVLKNYERSSKRSTVDAINLGNLREVCANRDLFDPVQKRLFLSALHEKRLRRVGFINDFVPNLGMLVFSHPTFLQRLCRCGQNNSRCKMRFWCPRCAYAAAAELWKTYLPRYDGRNFWFLTVSTVGDIPFGQANVYDLRGFWILLPALLHHFMNHSTYSIKGALTSNEVYVRQFLPTLINPHIHGTIDAEVLDGVFPNRLAAFLDQELAKASEGAIKCSIHVRRINTAASMKSALRYLVKPISLSTQYRTAWDSGVASSRHLAWELNNQVRDFITGTSLVSHYPTMMHHLRTYGTMNGASSGYIGVPAARRNDYWEEVKAIPISDDEWASYDESTDI